MAISKRVIARATGQMIHATANETSPQTGVLTDLPGTWYNLMRFTDPTTSPLPTELGAQLRPKYASSSSSIAEGGTVADAAGLTITELYLTVGAGYTMTAGVIAATRDAHAFARFRLIDIDETVTPRTTTVVDGFEGLMPNSVFTVISGPPPINFKVAEQALEATKTNLADDYRARIHAAFPLYSAFGAFPFHLAQDSTEPYTCIYTRDKNTNLIEANNPLNIAQGHILMVQGRIGSVFSDVGFEYDLWALGYEGTKVGAP